MKQTHIVLLACMVIIATGLLAAGDGAHPVRDVSQSSAPDAERQSGYWTDRATLSFTRDTHVDIDGGRFRFISGDAGAVAQVNDILDHWGALAITALPGGARTVIPPYFTVTLPVGSDVDRFVVELTSVPIVRVAGKVPVRAYQ